MRTRFWKTNPKSNWAACFTLALLLHHLSYNLICFFVCFQNHENHTRLYESYQLVFFHDWWKSYRSLRIVVFRMPNTNANIWYHRSKPIDRQLFHRAQFSKFMSIVYCFHNNRNFSNLFNNKWQYRESWNKPTMLKFQSNGFANNLFTCFSPF